MQDLSRERCVHPQRATPPLSRAEIDQWLPLVPGWDVIVVDDVPRLQKTFRFKNYLRLLEFAQQVGSSAEEQDHHPLMVIEWGKITLQWWTHAVNGLHRNDFIMAAVSDKLYQPYSTIDSA